ncbi:50S ribosomal protein L6 [Candidatus Shikimatogenerans silvanidophilus]|uniref:50S ribosomal protein L6 n=1 Tax=Candidatus Shikimatogenerans silvanidophilus TaxID=2782547 RepID=UPI001BABC0EE|nr:50S ribosomal protein L6 [Candidatus Shikimatogenerans silvanidophilus]
MSRIGKKPIFIPENVFYYIKIYKKNDNLLIVNGPMGKLKEFIPKNISLKKEKNKIFVNYSYNNIINKKKNKSIHGLYRMIIYNMIIGVNKKFEKKLELVGIGYRASFNDNNRILELHLGYSHSIMIQCPNEIDLKINLEKGKNTIIILKSCDKQLLGFFCSKIRSFRLPEPYKGKGIKYFNEILIRKTGKSTK